MAIQDSFMTYKRGRYAWVALILSIFSVVVYLMIDQAEPANGGTWLGYTLGTISALLIIWLILLGVRKRSYSSKIGTVRGWLSAHVYLGTMLLLITTLHAGFQIGWNVHTLAYVLVWVVVLSGFVGVYGYLRFPALLAGEVGSTSDDERYQELAELDRQIANSAEEFDVTTKTVVLSSIERTILGGNVRTQIFARDNSKVLLPSKNDKGMKLYNNAGQARVIDWLAAHMSKISDTHMTAAYQEVIDAIGAKQGLLDKWRKKIQAKALIQLWLYIHIPMAFALLAALTSHIFSIFIYW